METFAEPRAFLDDSGYSKARKLVLSALELGPMDPPIVDIVHGFASLPHCFPLQSCAGHFLWLPDQDIHSLDRLPDGLAGPVRYRIAYVAVCIENTPSGWALCESLAAVTRIDPMRVQFGSPDWFWDQRVNSFALQVGPHEQRFRDEVTVLATEALRLQVARDLFIEALRRILPRGSRI